MASYNPVDIHIFDEDKKTLIQKDIEIKNISEINEIKTENETEVDSIKVEVTEEVTTENDSDDDTEFIDNLKSDFAEYYVTKIEENELHIKQEDEEILPNEVNKNLKHKYSKKSQKSSLKRHLNNHDTINNKSKCDLCNIYVVNLKRHLLVHKDQKDYTCQYCDKNFTLVYNLKAHLVRHSGEVFTCFECNRHFKDKTDLRRHIITHGNNRRFKCNVCQKSFFFNKNLSQHMLTHTGEKNFKCNICKKSFSQHGHLKTHLVTHTDESKFKCDLCNVSFRFNSSLNKHIKRHGTSKQKKRSAAKSTKKIEIVK